MPLPYPFLQAGWASRLLFHIVIGPDFHLDYVFHVFLLFCYYGWLIAHLG